MKVSSVSTLIIAMLPALSAGNEVIAMAPAAEQAPIEEIISENAAIDSASASEAAITSEIAIETTPDSTASEADVAEAEAPATEAEMEYLDFSGAHFPTIHGTLLNSPYGIRKHRLHRGVDLHLHIGDSVVAAYPGKVVVSKYNRRGYGNYIMVEHANGTRTLYAHLQKRLVDVGATVEGGQLIGKGGNTGRSSGPHLHFEIRYGEVNIDPATVFDFEKGELLPNPRPRHRQPQRHPGRTLEAPLPQGTPRRHARQNRADVRDNRRKALQAKQDNPNLHPEDRAKHPVLLILSAFRRITSATALHG